MNESLRRGIRIVLLLVLLLALFPAATTAGAGQASQPGSEENASVNANSKGKIAESIDLTGLYQSGDPPGVDPQLIKKLKQNARGTVSISTNNSTQFASFVRVSKDGDLLPGNRNNIPRGKALGFCAQYGGLFGVKDAGSELTVLSSFSGKRAVRTPSCATAAEPKTATTNRPKAHRFIATVLP